MRVRLLGLLRLGLLALVAGVLGLLAGFGTASAYFAVVGLGSGTADSATKVTVTLQPGTVTPGLYPGASATVRTTASNPNSVPVRIAALALDPEQGSGGFAVDAGHPDCGLTTFTFATQTNAGEGWTVPADGFLSISLPGSVAATAATANACQGATLTVYLRAAT